MEVDRALILKGNLMRYALHDTMITKDIKMMNGHNDQKSLLPPQLNEYLIKTGVQFC